MVLNLYTICILISQLHYSLKGSVYSLLFIELVKPLHYINVAVKCKDKTVHRQMQGAIFLHLLPHLPQIETLNAELHKIDKGCNVSQFFASVWLLIRSIKLRTIGCFSFVCKCVVHGQFAFCSLLQIHPGMIFILHPFINWILLREWSLLEVVL